MDSSQLKPLVTLVALLALAGCASAPKSTVSVVEPNAELASVIGSAQQGAQVQLPPGNSLGVDNVVVGRTYFAASGRECRHLLQANGAAMQRVACKGEDGVWRFARDLSVSSSRTNTLLTAPVQLGTAQVNAPNDSSILSEAVEPIVVESVSVLPEIVIAPEMAMVPAEPVLLIPTPVVEEHVEIPASFQDAPQDTPVESISLEEAAIPMSQWSSDEYSDTENQEPKNQLLRYEIKFNETLWSFAKRTTGNALNWEAIARTNDIVNAKALASGTVLNVPASLVSRGD